MHSPAAQLEWLQKAKMGPAHSLRLTSTRAALLSDQSSLAGRHFRPQTVTSQVGARPQQMGLAGAWPGA